MIVNGTTATPGQRHAKLNKFDDSQSVKTEKLDKARSRLTKSVKYNAGRNNRGVKTTRGKGGQVKRTYRDIDFARDKRGVSAEVVSIDYDPNRSANIALLKYTDGEYRYILAPNNMKLGDEIIASEEFEETAPGNAHPLKVIPPATFVHNVELTPGQGGKLARSAGTSIQIQGRAGKGYVQLKMPSGEIRLVNGDCYATIGTVGNEVHNNEKVGKAGRNRRRGKRPIVRGVAQSYKHPLGGGQGKSGRNGAGRPTKDRWGNKRGVITRKRKSTNKFIIKRRTSKLRPRNKPYKTIV